MNLTQEEILLILKILEDSEFDELDLRMGSLILKARRKGAAASAHSVPGLGESAPPETPAAQARVDSNTREQIPAQALEEEEGLVPIKAPILGTFYRRPSPKEAPYVEVGTLVSEDDTVCLIEVMKVFSTIKAGIRGRIRKICVESGAFVEFGQVLFMAEPDGSKGNG